MRRLSLLLIAVGATACLSTSEPAVTLSPTDLDVGGSFALQLSAGSSLPLLAGFTATQEVDLIADTLVITEPSSWTETSYYVLTNLADGTQTTSQTLSSGTYAIANAAINFTMLVGGSSTFTGSVTGNTLSVLYSGSSYLYTRPGS
ncbi:MAG TPA: hypothetical protein VHV78_11285 [Gemmatimonadaceae bacterium]|nr:hypothetical protein [Gemmatimonadaceae bacterium]